MEPFVDCLRRAEIGLVDTPPAALCIGTVVSPGFEGPLDDMLGSLVANGNVPDARIAVFAVDADDRCAAVASKYGATLVPCSPLRPVNASIKSLLYSMALVVDARHYLGMDADMLVTGELGPLFAALEAVPQGRILVCRDYNGRHWDDLGHTFRDNYFGTDDEAALLELTESDLRYTFVVNDGVFAAGRDAMVALDQVLRSMPNAALWLDLSPDTGWRNQFLFNLALARLDAGVELDGKWNVQLHSTEVDWDASTPRLRATWRGRPAHVVHFSGLAKSKYPEMQGRYAAVERPLIGPTHGDGYAHFLAALRPWAGGRGIDVLSGAVDDVSTFPLFASLHYRIRSHGCARVIECGSGRGISAACLASAVWHRDGARVVTLGREASPDHDDLWNALPPAMRSCIESRNTDPAEGLLAALDAGERYDAALVDLAHAELARQLVRPGGLLLDPHGNPL